MKNAHTAKRIRIGFAISDDPDSGDEEFEQDGLRIFVEETLVEPLEDRTLDVEESDDGMRLVCLGPPAEPSLPARPRRTERSPARAEDV